MSKKLIMSCMALALTAFVPFVLPATASATNNPDLTESGARVAVGQVFDGTLVGTADFMATDGTTVQVSCNQALLTGSVTANSGGTLTGSITTADFWGSGGGVSPHNNKEECKGSFGASYYTVPKTPLTISSTPTMLTDEIQLTDSSKSTVTFIIGSTTAGACEYKTAGPIKGDFTTGATTVLTVRNTAAGSGASKVSGGFLCPSSWQLKMSFFLETNAAGNTELGIS
ncbi:MAG TPA: hypothetical protein VGW80_06680 [Solirubrobacterales bacterium]|jgi:hypothetical protein|nr:hypothetical protein [Solirubrobacterales bacterium]